MENIRRVLKNWDLKTRNWTWLINQPEETGFHSRQFLQERGQRELTSIDSCLLSNLTLRQSEKLSEFHSYLQRVSDLMRWLQLDRSNQVRPTEWSNRCSMCLQWRPLWSKKFLSRTESSDLSLNNNWADGRTTTTPMEENLSGFIRLSGTLLKDVSPSFSILWMLEVLKIYSILLVDCL